MFDSLIKLGDKEDKKNKMTVFVPCYGRGLATSRDAWCYNSNEENLETNIQVSIDFYNSEVDRYQKAVQENPDIKVYDFIKYDSTKFSWDRAQKRWIVLRA